MLFSRGVFSLRLLSWSLLPRRLRGSPVRREKTQSGADAVRATECALNVGAVLTGLCELHGGRGV